MNKEHPDANDELRHGGDDAVRARHDQSQKHQSNSNGQRTNQQGQAKPNHGPSTFSVIQLKAGTLSETASRGEQVLLDAGVEIYQRSGALVRPIIEEVDASRGRKTKIAQLAKLDATYLRDLIGRVAKCERWVVRMHEWVPCDPPYPLASTILARRGEWRFPIVSGVISTPTMRPDGSLLVTEGYDPITRLLLVAPPPMPPIPDAPTRDDALAALRLLEDLLDEFPFTNGVSKAVALSGLISPVVRGAFSVAPMHIITAPVAGSGKSFLNDVAASIAIGQIMPAMAAGRTEEETEKRLGAALLSGQPLISIDNVNGELAGDALCQIIERPAVEIRILGKSELVRIETRGTTMFGNGNNIVLVGDLCRRTITATLDPRLERPELREFKGDPVATVLADRGSYIRAALTICRAYIVAGSPNRAKRLASFEGWSDTVRSALIWLGKDDPVKSMEIVRAEDPERSRLRDFLEAWAKTVGIGFRYRRTLQEVIKRSSEHMSDKNPKWPELFDAVQSVASTARFPADARRLGNWARRNKDRIVGDLRLACKPNTKGGSEWWVAHTDGERGEQEGQWTAGNTEFNAEE